VRGELAESNYDLAVILANRARFLEYLDELLHNVLSVSPGPLLSFAVTKAHRSPGISPNSIRSGSTEWRGRARCKEGGKNGLAGVSSFVKFSCAEVCKSFTARQNFSFAFFSIT
jgi:hypothetical protein